MAEAFRLDPRLAQDTLALASWSLCEVRLMNDAHYPWVILVPRVNAATELYHLDAAQRLQLDRESIYLSQTLMNIFQGTKLNVAALGNVVSQLHLHHVVRFEGDLAWPGPIWGKVPPQPYSETEIAIQLSRLQGLSEARL